jgi:drug/metabolite transporter (DMT)-like permease
MRTSETIAVARPAPQDWLSYLGFAAACSIWGSTFLVIAIGNDVVPPLWQATLRLVLATVALAAVARISGAAFPRGASLRDVALFGVFQFGLNFGLLYWGEQTVPSGVTAVVYATIPLSAALFAWWLGVERPDRVRSLAAMLALLGVVVIFAGQLGVGVPAAGLAAVLASATFAALSSVFLKRAGSPSPLVANAIGSAVGAPICFAGALLLGERIFIPTTVGEWWPILYLTLLGSLGAYVIFAWLLQRWSVQSASMIAVVIPVIALALGAIVRDERPASLAYVGAAIVLAAVVIALRRASAAH